MLSYEKVIKEINYLLYDSHIIDEKTLNRIEELKKIVSNYMIYIHIDTRVSRNLSFLEERIDKYIDEYTLRKNELELQLDGYLPSCGSIELDELNYKINNLERLKNDLPYMQSHLIILSGQNYNIDKEKLINTCMGNCFSTSVTYFYGEKYTTDIYSKSFINKELLNRIGNILFNKELFNKLKDATIKYNEIEKLKHENSNMRLFIKYYDLINKRNKISYSKSLLDSKIMALTEDEIDPLERKITPLLKNKYIKALNILKIKSSKSRLSNLILYTENLFEERTKRQNCLNKIEAFLSSKGLDEKDIPDILYSKRQYEYLIKENEEVISLKEIEYQKYLDSLDIDTKKILLDNFKDVTNIINIFGLNNSNYIDFYIMYILAMLQDMELTLEETKKEFSSEYCNNMWNELENAVDKEIKQIDGYQIETKKLTKKNS